MIRQTINEETQRAIDAYVILINNDPRLSDIAVQLLINKLRKEWNLK